jgi:hypothetical protein
MTENNFRVDYMDVEYACKICGDTGVLDNGARCACFAEHLGRLQSPAPLEASGANVNASVKNVKNV